ncbi:transmembrane and coiled-coil domains protein 1-like isoform X2 [Clavelina lepadiformis]|uniref:transmembrane and coiled-coil domains protein 1-like isoform X2 n=1 Tax=Clavelina lepadiformis TaxID=159417 RepID=UPI0040439464
MDTNEEDSKQIKTRQKWNPFQRGARNKSAGSNLSSQGLNTHLSDSELQRVSFATSIDELPERPTAFKQVLRQIGANKNSQSPFFKRAKMSNLKKLNKDSRGSSPQGQLSVTGTTSACQTMLDIPSHTGGRPRSSSIPGSVSERKHSLNLSEDLMAPASERNSLENTARIPSAGSSSGQLPAGQVLEQMILPAMASQLSTAYSQDSSSLTSYDSVDGSPANEERSKQLTEHYKQKIIKTSEQIKTEQSTRDDNVAEYLKLATNADKQQAARIKNVFEKKNQKSSYNIAQLQKKLDGYHRRLKELENNGGGRSGRLRDVGANLKEISGGVVDSVKGSLSGLQQATGAIVSKPKDLASKLKNRFGSNDNINNIKDDDYEENQLHAKFGSTDDVSSTSSIDYPSVPDDPNQLGRLSFPSGSDSPPCSQVSRRFDSQQIQAVANQLVTLKTDIQELRQSQTQMESEWQEWKAQMHKEHDILTNTLNVEMSRYARLENQLNDVTELHQREVTMLKQELTSMEEKLEYHANERARDMQEAIENCQTRVAKMELQHQQRVSVEGLENASARALITKLINLLLSVMAVILVLVSTVSGLLMPFMRSQGRMLTTLIVVIAMIVAYKNWNLISVWLGSLRR